MPQAYRKFIIRLTILLAIMAFLGLLIQSMVAPQYFPPHYLYLLGFFYLLSAGAHYILVKANAKSPKRFIPYFMAVSGLKLLSLIAVLCIYVLLINPDGAIAFMAGFATLYVVFTAFDISALVGEVRKEKE